MTKFAWAITIFLVAVMASAGRAGSGELDATFGSDGIVTIIFGVDSVVADTAVQADGKILVAGTSYAGIQQLVLARLHVDGTLDAGFGANGVARLSLGGDPLSAGIALQGDGKIVMVGESMGAEDLDVTLLRFNPDGILDGTFGDGGVVLADPGLDDTAGGVALQPDGKILVTGRVDESNAQDRLFVARYDANGLPDPSFAGGLTTTALGYQGNALLVLPDGRIIAAGMMAPGSMGTLRAGLIRFTAEGLVDADFGNGGLALLNSAYPAVYDVVQQGTRLVLAGDYYLGGDLDMALARFNSSGELDTTFGDEGIVLIDSGYGWDEALAIDVTADEQILVGGFLTAANAVEMMAVLRVNWDGTLDPAFSHDGIALAHAGRAQALAQQADGKIILAGQNSGAVVVARFEVTGVNHRLFLPLVRRSE